MKIGLLGAAFDPPHLGHWQVTKTVLEEQILDQVWWVPVQQHPLAKNMTSKIDRQAMSEAALAEHQVSHPELADRLRLEQFELTHSGPSYSYRTLTALSQKYPNDKFTWIMGADNLRQSARWYEYQALLQEFGVMVYPRPAYPLDPVLPGMRILHSVPEVATSSTQIRERANQGQAIDDLVTKAVAKYIKEHRLYQ